MDTHAYSWSQDLVGKTSSQQERKFVLKVQRVVLCYEDDFNK